MRQKKLIQFLAAAIMVVATAFPLAAQEDVYVDAPVANEQPTAPQGSPAGNYKDQFNWGIVNYGFTENVYYQFSGNSIFSGGNSPSSFLNMGWIKIVPMDFKYLPAIGYGGDFTFFSSTSEDVYSGDSDTVTGPEIDMTFYTTNFKLRLFFMDPIEELLHPFFGLSWGLIFGDFKTTKVGGSKHNTSFLGMSISRNLGVQVKLGDRGGLVTEFRTVAASSVSTSGDPFDQGSDGSVDLDFSGITIALTGYYRF